MTFKQYLDTVNNTYVIESKGVVEFSVDFNTLVDEVKLVLWVPKLNKRTLASGMQYIRFNLLNNKLVLEGTSSLCMVNTYIKLDSSYGNIEFFIHNKEVSNIIKQRNCKVVTFKVLDGNVTVDFNNGKYFELPKMEFNFPKTDDYLNTRFKKVLTVLDLPRRVLEKICSIDDNLVELRYFSSVDDFNKKELIVYSTDDMINLGDYESTLYEPSLDMNIMLSTREINSMLENTTSNEYKVVIYEKDMKITYKGSNFSFYINVNKYRT